MVFSVDSLFSALLFILPAYFANAFPVVAGGGAPIDLGAKFKDGNRLFGDGKTIRGFLAGVLAGTAIGAILGFILPGTAFAFFDSPITYAICGFLLGLGTMLGDLCGSFIKRRFGMKRGQSSLLLDQLFFLLFALAFALPLSPRGIYTIENIVFLAGITYVAHIGSNFIANRLGMKKVPW